VNFEVMAIERDGDRRLPCTIRLEPGGFDPRRGYACSLELSGAIEFASLVYGAFPFQASALAHELARTLMEDAEREWRFEVPEMGEISFVWTPPSDTA
jgi:hypothetical protein